MPAASRQELSRRRVLGNAVGRRELRALALIFTCFKAAEMGAWIAVTTIAHQNGGIEEAGQVVVAQLAPAAMAATGISALVRRIGLRRVLCGGLILQSTALIGIATLLWLDAPSVAVYSMAVLGAVAVVSTRPTVAVLMPLVVDGTHELTAANSILGWLDGASVMIGPVITGVGFALAGAAAPFVAFSVLTVIAGLAALRLTAAQDLAPGDEPAGSVAPAARAVVPASEPSSSRSRSGVAPILVILASHAFLIGALDLLYVVVALDVTSGAPSRASWLNTAFGVGALIGGAASTLLIGRPRLSPTVLGAGLGAALSIALVGQSTHVALSAVTFGACGLCSGVLFVATRTLLQRCSEVDSVCRAFSLAEAAEMAMLLVGALMVPLFVGAVNAALAPVGVAAVLVAALLMSAPQLIRVERHTGSRVEGRDEHAAVEAVAAVATAWPVPAGRPQRRPIGTSR